MGKRDKKMDWHLNNDRVRSFRAASPSPKAKSDREMRPTEERKSGVKQAGYYKTDRLNDGGGFRAQAHWKEAPDSASRGIAFLFSGLFPETEPVKRSSLSFESSPLMNWRLSKVQMSRQLNQVFLCENDAALALRGERVDFFLPLFSLSLLSHSCLENTPPSPLPLSPSQVLMTWIKEILGCRTLICK